jgi:tetratricopeptide (TPR) repeat protein
LQGELRQRRPAWSGGFLIRGLLEQAKGNMAEAVGAFETAIRLGDQRVFLYERVVNLLVRQGRLADADQYLARLEQQIPLSASLSSLAISVATGREDRTRALILAEQGVENRPQDPQAWIWQGQIQLLVGQVDQAKASFEKAIELAPREISAWSGLFSFYLRTEQPQLALETLERAVQQVEVTDVQRDFIWGQGFELLGDHERAAEKYRAAMRQSPDSVPILLRMSAFLLRTSPPDAEPVLRRLLTLTQGDESLRAVADNTRRTLAALLAARGEGKDFDEAMQLLRSSGDDRRAAELDRRLQAILLTQRTNPDLEQAQKLLESLIYESKTGADGDFQLLAQVYQRQSERLSGKARQTKLAAAYRQYSTLCNRAQPNPAHLINYLDLLLREEPDHAAIDPLLKQLHTHAPGDWRTIALQARRLKTAGRTGEIEPLVEQFAARLVQSAENDAARLEALTAVGQIYTVCGMPEAAVAWYRQAFQLDSGRYAALADALAAQGKTDEAIELCFDQAESKATVETALRLSTALIVGHAPGDRVRAGERIIAQRIQENPGEHRLQLALANLRMLEARYEDAIQLYRGVLQLQPENVIALNNLATLLSERPGKAAEALEYIEQAIRISGERALLLDTKGMALLFDNRPAEAVEFLERAIAQPEPDPRYHFHLALALDQTGELERAREQLQQAHDRHLIRQTLTSKDKKLLQELEARLNPP